MLVILFQFLLSFLLMILFLVLLMERQLIKEGGQCTGFVLSWILL